MDIQSRLQTLQAACPKIEPSVVQDFAQRMDPDYFLQFKTDVVVDHLRLTNQLTPDRPCALQFHKKTKNTIQLTLVAYDYFSEFATICGVLSSYGLNIREAFIFTYTEAPSQTANKTKYHTGFIGTPRWRPVRSSQPLGLSRKKVVDVFLLEVLPGFEFTKKEQTHLEDELLAMIRLLEAQHVRQVRRQVNRHLVETLGKLHTNVADFLHPVEIEFNNSLSPHETVMDIGSTDTPAFLYTFANALTMRGIYVAKAKIEVEGTRVRNRFYVRGRQGQKIDDSTQQQELTAAAALIKEFTHFLTWAPDPAKALEHFDQLLDQLLEDHQQTSQLSLFTQKPLLEHLAQLFGTSDYLWEDFLRRQHTNLLPIMEEYQDTSLVRSKTDLTKALRTQLGKQKAMEARKALVNQFKDQELFRIDMKHLLEHTALPDFSCALTNLAEVILDQVLTEALTVIDRQRTRPKLSSGKPVPFTICGLGKLGGRELGYASDIEVLFVYDSGGKGSKKTETQLSEYFELVVQEILRWIEAKQEGIFHIDTRLRPHGDKGVLANSLQEVRRYYHRQGAAAPLERQALIKLRQVAGDKKLGHLVEHHRDEFVYSPQTWDLKTALHLRSRQINELVEPGTTHVKYSPGGLIDVEYTIQYLQLMHGHESSTIQTPNTLLAIAALQEARILKKDEGRMLHEDYVFLRQLIDALRIVRGHAKDLILPKSKSDGMIFLARRLGFITQDWQEGAKRLEKEIHRRMKRVHQNFLKRFGREQV